MGKKLIAFCLALLMCTIFASAYKWQFGEAVVLSPVIYGNEKVYAGSYTGTLFALSLQSGSVVWRYETESPIEVAPSPAGSLVVVGTKEGKVYAFDADSGLKKWSTNGTERVAGLLGTNSLVYASTEAGTISALDVATGKEKWTVKAEAPMGGIGSSGNTVFVGSGDNIVALDAGSGYERWRAYAGKPWRSAPEATESIVFIGTADTTVSAFNAASGTLLWTYKTAGWIEGGITENNGVVYFGSDDGYAYAIDAKAGSLIWKHQCSDAVTTKPIILVPSVGTAAIVVATNDGKVWGLSAATGESFWSIDAGTRLYGGAENSGYIYMGSKRGVFALAKTGCSIEDPVDGGQVPEGDIIIRGSARAENGVRSVKVSVDGGPFEDAIGTSKWSYTFAAGSQALANESTIECRVVDSDGNEEQPPLTTITVQRSKDAPPRKMRVAYQTSFEKGDKLVLNASDSEYGDPLTSFTVEYEGKKYEGRNGRADIALTGEGIQKFAISKPGYSDYSGAVEVAGSGLSSTLIFGLVVVLLIVGGGYFLFRKPPAPPQPKE